MRFAFWRKDEPQTPPPVATESARVAALQRRLAGMAMQRQMQLPPSERSTPISEILNAFRGTELFGHGVYPSVGYVWQAQALYELDGYTAELIGNIVDFAVGSHDVVDFGNDRRNREFRQWQWNPLNPLDRPNTLQQFIPARLMVDGDLFLQKDVAPDRCELFPLDARFIWSGSWLTGLLPGGVESQGVKLGPDLRPVAYVYQPTLSNPWEVQPADYREIPAHRVIHAFRTETYGQVRGSPWIRRAMKWLTYLEEFDGLMHDAGRRFALNPGYWSVPDELMLQDPDRSDDAPELDPDPEDPQDIGELAQVRKMVQAVLAITRWDDVHAEFRLPKSIEWNQKPHSGVQQDIFTSIRQMLVERIARSMGLSAMALTASSGSEGYLTARIVTHGDQRFYETVRLYTERALAECVDFYGRWASLTRRRGWTQYRPGDFRLAFPAFPHSDPLKDTTAQSTQLRDRVLSPQEVIRQRGGDPDQVSREIIEWAKKFAEELSEDGDAPVDAVDALLRDALVA